MNAARYGAVIMAAGPAGEVAASRLSTQGVKVALFERELAGEWIHYAALAIKTKTRSRCCTTRSRSSPRSPRYPKGVESLEL